MVPEISIITPIYNGESFLEEMIKSVLKQSYRNFELLLCDDGSIDRTLDICQYWANQDSRILIYRHQGGRNQGVSATRNLGVQNAKGRFIAFLDVDDMLMPHSLSKRIQCFEENPEVGLVFSPAFVINEKGDPTLFNNSFTIGHFGPVGIPSHFESLLIQSPGIITSTVMVRRSSLNGLRFMEGLELQYEDWLLWTQLSTRCLFFQHPEILSYYRVHNNQAIGKNLLKYYRCCLYFYRKLLSLGWNSNQITPIRNNLFFGILQGSLRKEPYGLPLHQLLLYFLLYTKIKEKWSFLKLFAYYLTPRKPKRNFEKTK